MEGTLRQGQIVAGRFRIDGFIGKGGMGRVYRASHLTLGREYAIKVLRGRFTEDETFVERFRREAIAASRVVHPNVVYITDFGQLEDGAYYIVMEHLDGVGLDEVIDAGGAQPMSRVLPIWIQLADALDYSAAVGIVHRDLKPENIMLCKIRGRQDVVKLVDFGIAKILSAEFANKRITLSGQIFGTPEYISPEGAMDFPVDGRSDIYSLGILGFELLTGAPPFEGEPAEILQMHVQKPPPTPSTLMPKQPIPPALDGILLRCLAKRPEDRYQTAAELCRDLLKLRGQLAGMAEELLGPGGANGKGRVKTTGTWAALSAQREPMLLVLDDRLGEERAPTDRDAPARQQLPDLSQTVDLRAAIHRTLRELAFALAEAAIRSDDLSGALSEILRLEEEIQSVTGKIRLLEQNFERIRFEAADQETSLRYASLDLKLMRSKRLEHLQEAPSPELKSEVRDLSFQIETLDTRLEEIQRDKKVKTQHLNEEVLRYRAALSEREVTIAGLYTELHLLVEGVRSRADSAHMQQLYQELDAISERLNLARKSVRLSPKNK